MLLVTSDRGVYGSIDYAHYASTKGGMIALTRASPRSSAAKGITVNGLNPGLTDTPLGSHGEHRLGGQAEDRRAGQDEQARGDCRDHPVRHGTAGGFMTGQIIGNRMRFGM